MLRWKASGVVDACTEFFVVVLACVVVIHRKMQTNTKISALSSFLPRLLFVDRNLDTNPANSRSVSFLWSPSMSARSKNRLH